jgi:hypothetical protein
LVGLRGVGKTVLLVKIKDIADVEGFHSISVEAHEGKRLPELLLPGIRKALISFSAVASAVQAGRRGLRVLRSFISSVKVSVNDVEYGLSISPELGTADSGDLEADLPELMMALGEAAKAAKRPVAILIDELQYLSTSEFSALIMSIHKLNQASLPVIMVGAGLCNSGRTRRGISQTGNLSRLKTSSKPTTMQSAFWTKAFSKFASIVARPPKKGTCAP